MSDPSYILASQAVQLNENLSYEEQPMVIVDRQVKKLRSKNVSLVKVIQRNHSREEATWEADEVMRAKYPQLFETQG